MFNYNPSLADRSHLARWLQVLGHPNRLGIYDLLMEGVQCNCEIHSRLGLSLSLISHHMRILEEAGLVVSERDAEDGRWIYYSVDQQALEQLTGALGRFLSPERIKPRLPSCGPRATACVPADGGEVSCRDGACEVCRS